MEPILPMPNNLESSSPAPEVQQAPGALQGVESVSGNAPERSGERHPSVAPSATAIPMPIQALPTAQPAAAPSISSAQPAADPLIADDVDVIEKEWVDKAKKIVSATKEDPYQQEKEVSKLQADYLMKRYNKKVKLTE